MARDHAGVRTSVVAADAGFLTEKVRGECRRRRWWCPVVGRNQGAVPICRPRPSATSGLHTMAAEDAASQWNSIIAGGRLRLPATMTRSDVIEACASETLTATDRGSSHGVIGPSGRRRCQERRRCGR